MSEKDEKWELPAPHRLTPDLLAAADAKQAEWAAAGNVPFANLSPKERERVRAVSIATDKGVSPAERYEAYLTLGRFDLAMRVPQIGNELYLDALSMAIAVEKDDSEWCAHQPQAQYVEREIYSVRHGSDAYLLRCNECGFRNIAPELPAHIVKARAARREMRAAAKGLNPMEFKKNFGRGR